MMSLFRLRLICASFFDRLRLICASFLSRLRFIYVSFFSDLRSIRARLLPVMRSTNLLGRKACVKSVILVAPDLRPMFPTFAPDRSRRTRIGRQCTMSV